MMLNSLVVLSQYHLFKELKMAIDQAEYISELLEESPFNSDPRAEGAGQIRASKRAVKNSFPNVAGEVEADHVRMNEVFSYHIGIGMIMMWSPTGGDIPTGWKVCDGTTYTIPGFGVPYVTPDLSNKFIKGSGAQAPGGTGGDNTLGDLEDILTLAPHRLTENELPAHKHDSSWGEKVGSGTPPFGNTGRSPSHGSGDTDGDNVGWWTSTVGGNQPHTHGLTSSAGTIDNQPEYYVLTYIVYVGPTATAF
jgi:hypothetical protein